MKVLIVAAHPDDEVLGCGGTIPKLVRQGGEVYIAILGEGVTSRYKQREEADMNLVKEIHNRSHKVAKILEAKDLFLYNLPDNRFDVEPLLDVVKIVEELVDRVKPETVYTHHGGDLNIDHAITHRAVLTATRPTVNQPVQEIYTFEVPSSTEWSFQRFEKAFHPNFFLDISDTLNLKIEALSCYDSEVSEFPHPRSQKAIEAIARHWGSVVGRKAAEAFELIRAIR